MTGLNPDSDEIIEIFCIITDGKLNVLDPEGWGTVVHQTQERMDQMDDWCTRTHAGSGLTAAVVASTVTPQQAADELLAYIQKYVPDRGALLAGNSVHADRAFLRKEPYRKVTRHLHHRLLDVSAIKEAAKRWSPEGTLKEVPMKRGLHQAKTDILESIEEARFYMERIFSSPGGLKQEKTADEQTQT